MVEREWDRQKPECRGGQIADSYVARARRRSEVCSGGNVCERAGRSQVAGCVKGDKNRRAGGSTGAEATQPKRKPSSARQDQANFDWTPRCIFRSASASASAPRYRLSCRRLAKLCARLSRDATSDFSCPSPCQFLPARAVCCESALAYARHARTLLSLGRFVM